MLKKALRDTYLKKRLELNPQAFAEATSVIVNHFESLQLQNVKKVLSYYPILSRNEFDVSHCTEILVRNNPLVQIGWPRIDAEKNTMEGFTVSPDGLYSKNKYNILEPINGIWMDPETIDLVLIPLLCFTTKGFRVGYGKGYYDRFLVRCKPDVIKLGFSFFDPVDAIEDIDQFDVPLSYCITPSRIYEF